ncbi:PDZ domain-containing protein [Evansella sp. LMS18]|uniref:PDZ domain-containing protein n=1 Tax=Evansella sp. LMS18 TaxID=2924033 RepID=UPI0020D0C8F4|nr:PDZ domain-containing protein [Evansella sp. LMS18]UTR11730.1 PDZ domain-containing protein [Evansella sp. LMS18]
MEVIAWELLSAFGRLWLHPLTYIFILAVLWIGVKRVKRERKDFHTRIFDVIHGITFPLMAGLLFGLAMSVVFVVTGIELPMGIMVLITLIWLLFLPFRNLRWLSMTAVGSIALLAGYFLPSGGTEYPVVNNWLSEINEMNMVGFAWVLTVLLAAEALLVLVNGRKDTSPRLFPSKRGKIVGGHEASRLWLAPALVLFPAGAITFDGWWPLFTAGGGTGSGLIFIPFILGFHTVVQSQFPDQGIKKLGTRLLWFSLLTVVFMGAATYWPVLVPAVAAVILLGREFIFLSQRSGDKNRTSLFTRREEGLVVLGVLPHSTAEKMGIETGEIVTKVNGWDVSTQREIYEALQNKPAYCKIQVRDRNGEPRIVQSSVYEGEHYHLGLLFVPDDEMINLSARGLRSSVVIHNDRKEEPGEKPDTEEKLVEKAASASDTKEFDDKISARKADAESALPEGYFKRSEKQKGNGQLSGSNEDGMGSAAAASEKEEVTMNTNWKKNMEEIAAEMEKIQENAIAALSSLGTEGEKAVARRSETGSTGLFSGTAETGTSAFYEEFKTAHNKHTKWRPKKLSGDMDERDTTEGKPQHLQAADGEGENPAKI